MSVKLVIERCMLYLMSLYYGIIVTFKMAKLAVSLGPGAVSGSASYPRPEELDDPELGEHGVLHLEDVRLHYVASGPEDKPLMLFLHGFPEFWYSWRHQIREFQNNYRVVAVDQRGYNKSDKPKGAENYVLPKLMNDVRQVIEALGYKSCILVAHDWGGGVAWAFARHFPDYVDKLIVMNAPPGPVMARAFKEVKEQVKMSWYMFLFQLPYLPELFMRHCNFSFIDRMFGISSPAATDMVSTRIEAPQADIDAYKYIFSQPGSTTPPIDWYRANLRSRMVYDMGYTMPVLLIWGMQDIALHKCIPELTEQMKGSANISVRRVPEAGHFIQFDKPDIVNNIMREWLVVQG